MEAFFIENPVSNRLTGLLATHPSIEERVEALQRYAGALDAGTAGPPTQPGPHSVRCIPNGTAEHPSVICRFSRTTPFRVPTTRWPAGPIVHRRP